MDQGKRQWLTLGTNQGPSRWTISDSIGSQSLRGKSRSLGATSRPPHAFRGPVSVIQAQGDWAALRHTPGVCEKTRCPRSSPVGKKWWPWLEANPDHLARGWRQERHLQRWKKAWSHWGDWIGWCELEKRPLLWTTLTAPELAMNSYVAPSSFSNPHLLSSSPSYQA